MNCVVNLSKYNIKIRLNLFDIHYYKNIHSKEEKLNIL